MPGLMGLDSSGGGYAPGSIQYTVGPDGMYYAINPATGKTEPLYNDNDTSRLYFASDVSIPASASPAGTPQYFNHDSMGPFEYGVLGGLGALTLGAGGALAGVGPFAGTAASSLAGADAAAGLTPEFGTTAAYDAGIGAGGAGAGSVMDLGGGLSVDASGNIVGNTLFQGGPGTAGAGDFFSGGASGLDFSNLKDLAGLAPLANLFTGKPGATGPGGINLGGSGGFDPMALIPGGMALSYAAMQPNIDLGNLNAVLGSLKGNQNAVIKAATDPVQANIAAGYGDLLQSQAARGIRGSSFGDTDISNYLANTSNTLGNVAANAAQGSLALQGNVASQIAALQNQNQQIKNNLYGTAFDVLGRGLNPKGYTNSINLGGAPMVAGAPGATGNPLAGLFNGGLTGLSSLYNTGKTALGDVSKWLSGLGSGGGVDLSQYGVG